MELIKGLITLGVAMVALKAAERAKEKLDKLENIDARTKKMEKDIERIDWCNRKNWAKEEWKTEET